MNHCFLGWNLNIDAIIHLENAADVQKCYDKLHETSPEIAQLFMETIQQGSAHEALVPPSVTKVLTDNFQSEFVIAGQVGFFLRNIISSFPKLIPVTHLPNRSKMLVEMLQGLSEKIMVFGESGKLVSIKDVKIDAKADPPVHAVVEYNSGLTFTAHGKEVTTVRNNRFIFTFDETNSNMHLDKCFMEHFEHVVDKSWMFLIAGYHLLTADVITDKFRDLHADLLARIAKRCGHLHFELAFANVKAGRTFTLERLLPCCKSVGLNEVELKMFAEDEGITTSSEVERLKEFAQKTATPIILFHTFGKYVAINKTHEHYNFLNGFKTAENVVLVDRRVPTSEEFHRAYAEEQQLDGMIHYSPTLLKPISSSVGLGDTISSSIVIGMMQK